MVANYLISRSSHFCARWFDSPLVNENPQMHQNPKYFTLWKRKLRDERAVVGRIDSPGLVPVVVRSERAASAPTEASGMHGAAGELGETYMIPKGY